MSENIFYESLLELPSFRVDGVEKTPTQLLISGHVPVATSVCPQCAQATGLAHQYTTRLVRDLNILHREVWLKIRVKQFACIPCERYFSPPLDFAESGKSYTTRQAKWIFLSCAKQPFTEVGALLNMIPKTVERIYYEYGQQKLNLAARYAQVRRLGIDEIAHRKGKADYCCVLTDLDRNIQLDILPDRKKETLLAHFELLGNAFCQQIQAVSFDMWRPYLAVSQHCFPNARLVIDRFHVVKALNQTLDQYRQQLRKKNPNETAFTHIKWALFKKEHLPQEAQKMQAAFEQAPELEELVGLRNHFHALFEIAPTAQWLQQQLTIWKQEAQALALPILDPFLKTLANWLPYVANFGENRLTNAATEGLNNIIRYVKRISFGLPNFQHMRLRVLLNSC